MPFATNNAMACECVHAVAEPRRKPPGTARAIVTPRKVSRAYLEEAIIVLKKQENFNFLTIVMVLARNRCGSPKPPLKTYEMLAIFTSSLQTACRMDFVVFDGPT